MSRNNSIKTIFISVFLLFVINNLKAQNFNVKGTVVNAESGAPVEFANIGIESTYLGTATDLDGIFELQLSNTLSDHTVTVSAVGYKAKSFVVKDLIAIQNIKIQLAPVNYGISEVNVEAKSMIGYGILKTASNLIIDNYITSPFSYKCYINTILSNNINKEQKKSESIFLLADKNGYKFRSFTDAFQSRNYKIIENKSNKPVNSLLDGITSIDQIINADVVRCPGNILSVASVNDFDVNILGEDVLGKDSVWVINYVCKKTNMQNCGDPEALSYKGKIWITMANNAILKYTSTITRKGFFVHGNSFNNPDDSAKEEVKYLVEATYKKSDNKYVLNTINYSEKGQGISNNTFLKVVEILPYDGSIKSRNYYNNVINHPNFWGKFDSPNKQ